MSITTDMLRSLVSVTQFNKGQASKIFDRLKNEKHIVVLKNNAPSAIILSPEEFERIIEIEENYKLLLEANERMEKSNLENNISLKEVLNELDLTDEDIENAEDVEIE